MPISYILTYLLPELEQGKSAAVFHLGPADSGRRKTNYNIVSTN
jgi:hypothetical protein